MSKNRHIALLRGINVSGQKKMPMALLRKLLAEINMDNVQSYIQSGNIVFESEVTDPNQLAKAINDAIELEFGFSVPIAIRTPKQWEQIIRDNPFVPTEPDISKLYVAFLSDLPTEEGLARLEAFDTRGDEYIIKGRHVYLHYGPNGIGRSKLTNNLLESKLKVIATTRNWRTTLKINELAKK